MFNTIREFILTRRLSAQAKKYYINAKRKTERLVASRARADREAVSRLATAVEGIQFAFSTWLKGPSSSTAASDVALDLFLSRTMEGVAHGCAAMAEYLQEKADSKRKHEGLRSLEQRKAERLAQIIGTVHMAMGQTVSFIVEADSADGIARKINEMCLQQVTMEDIDEPGKTLLIVRSASETDGDQSSGGGESVH